MDQVDAAIAAAIAEERQPQPVQMRQWQVKISSTGRRAAAVLPADATDGEVAEFAGWLLTVVMNTYRSERERRPVSRLLVPRA